MLWDFICLDWHLSTIVKPAKQRKHARYVIISSQYFNFDHKLRQSVRWHSCHYSQGFIRFIIFIPIAFNVLYREIDSIFAYSSQLSYLLQFREVYQLDGCKLDVFVFHNLISLDRKIYFFTLISITSCRWNLVVQNTL